MEASWFEIEGNDIEINELPASQEEKWERIEASVDCGSTDSVAPKDLFKQFKLRPSEGSVAGRSYI